MSLTIAPATSRFLHHAKLPWNLTCVAIGDHHEQGVCNMLERKRFSLPRTCPQCVTPSCHDLMGHGHCAWSTFHCNKSTSVFQSRMILQERVSKAQTPRKNLVHKLDLVVAWVWTSVTNLCLQQVVQNTQTSPTSQCLAHRDNMLDGLGAAPRRDFLEHDKN